MGKKKTPDRSIKKGKFLGDFVLNPYRFDGLEGVFKAFKTKDFQKLNHKQQSEGVNQALLDLILNSPEESFLMIAALEFIDKVAKEKVLEHYTLSSFELWLNQFSNLSDEDNFRVRGKIVGKGLPRDAYQTIFPVGMGKVHPGSHYVTAHSSPDLDTTIASFWGWVDAFGARVAEGVHLWNVPGGAPASSIEVTLLFHHIFGKNVFQHVAKDRTSLALSSLELMTQRGVIKQRTDQSFSMLDHERTQKAIVLVDEWGYYLGDWRSFDVEGVRQVILLLNNCLRWFENHFHINLISLFAHKELKRDDFIQFIEKLFKTTIADCGPSKEFNDKQKRYMEGFFKKVLKMEKGLGSSFAEFADALKELASFELKKCYDHLTALSESELFDSKGMLIEDRPKLFHHLEEVISGLDAAIQSVRLYTEKLDVALSIKTQVFGYLPQVVSYRDEVEELKSKMGNYPYLTVTSSDDQGRMLPLGVVRSRDLQQPILGTVTLRDFCNRDETKIPSYFEVISVIDHHKTVLQTSSAPVVYISDAQSSNAVVAELAFQINDHYGGGGLEIHEIEAQIQEVQKDLSQPGNKRILQKLLKRLNAAHKLKDQTYFVDPLREFVEYLHFLYAILDDTDLLTKVSRRDVECVARLLNRMKSLMEGKVVEIIQFDDIKQDETFVYRCANRILQHPDMYSLYRKIYIAKEQLVEENLALCAKGEESNIFADTKLQNGCVRIGQTKMFANNFPSFEKHSETLRLKWLERSAQFFSQRREFDLYLQMVSTIAGAEDVYKGEKGDFRHKDALWIWIPMTELSIEHLKSFLNEFKASPQIAAYADQIEVEFLGLNAHELQKVFAESFLSVPHTFSKEGEEKTMAIVRYPAGAINSRKSMISPYLPQLIN